MPAESLCILKTSISRLVGNRGQEYRQPSNYREDTATRLQPPIVVYGGMRELLGPGGLVLIADEVNDEGKKEQHLLSIAEHETGLKTAGFDQFRTLLEAGDLSLFMACRA